MTNKTNDVLAAALRYATERGWHVFPVPPNTKASYKSEEYSGTKWGATSNPVVIARDFTNPRFPNPGVGVACAPSGFIVVDVDVLESHPGGKDGLASLAKLEAEHGKLPDTLTARTATGGRHIYLKQPSDGGPEIGNSMSKIGIGVDVRGAGGMVVLPPTRTDRGEYTWVNDLPIAPAPDWLIALARKKHHRGNGGDYPPIEFANGTPDTEVDLEEIAWAMAELPNETIEGAGSNDDDPRHFNHDDRLGILMALHRVFGGGPEGRRIFDAWSAKNPDRHFERKIAKTWAHFNENPVTDVTAATIYHYANRAAPGWRDRYYDAAERRLEAANRDPELHAMMMASFAGSPEAASTNTNAATASAGGTNADAKPDNSSTQANPPAEAAKPAPKTKAKPKKAAKASGRPMTALPLTFADAVGGGEIKERVVDAVNERHAFVLTGGSSAAVMRFDADGRTFRLIGIDAFKAWYANKAVPLGGDKPVSPADLWFGSRNRREYEGIEFAPAGARAGYYNLWQGFAVEPRSGDCGKFLAHIRDNVAQGDPSLYNWVVGWFAQIAQQPDKKIGTALALRGEPGVGKTKVGEVFGSLFRDHYKLVSDPRYVTGNFNSHMASLLLLHADEAFWAGDRRSEGKLKDLVTGYTHFLEFKRVDPISVRNLIRLFVTGNSDWLVPAAFRERRWAVLDVGAGRIQDHAYFAAIDDEMNNGGREALLHHLLNFDLKTVNLRAIPQTAALLEQKFATATAEEVFWLDTLKSGRLPGALETAPDTCLKEKLYEAYIRHASRTGQRHRSIEVKVGMFLSRHVGPRLVADEKVKYVVYNPRGDKITKRGPAYRFPPLADCREAFAKMINQDVDWGTDVVDWQADALVEVEPAEELTYDEPGERGSS